MIVSVSGFGWSGSGAVLDFLREYDDLNVAFDGHYVDPEFILLAENDGIRDLEYHLVENPCRLSSYLAIKRYRQLVKSYNKYMKVDRIFEGKLLKITDDYLDKLVDFRFEGATYHEYYQTTSIQMLYNKLVCYVLGNKYSQYILKDFYKHFLYEKVTDIAVSYNPKQFLHFTKEYINTIFSFLRKDLQKTLVVDQMFPPDNPLVFMRYVEESRCIAVRRDPRDSYLLAKCAYNSNIAVPVNNVDNFIIFYRKIVEDTVINDNPYVLNICFEDLIYQYEKTKLVIEKFLGISKHARPKSKFNPAISINNTQLFKKYSGYEEDIRKIEESLPNSLYPFDEEPQIERVRSKVF